MRPEPAVEALRKLEMALEYARRGWALLPIAPCSKSPHSDLLPLDPLIRKPSWKLLALRPASEPEIYRWFEHDPTANIGVICGKASGGLIVADFDKPIPSDWQKPLTPRVITGRGEHFYLKGDCSQHTHNLYHKGDSIGELRGEGSYVVLPPSLHQSGSTYHWADLLSPDELDWELAPPPDWATNPHQEYGQLINPTSTKIVQGKQVKDILYLLTLGTTGHELGAWCKENEFVIAVARKLGIDPKHATPSGIGTAFKCILPGHNDNHPSASLYRRDDGMIVYHDWHMKSVKEWYYLAEVYASQAYNHCVELSSPGLATWQLRMLVDTGFIEPADVNLPPLPLESKQSVKCVYDGFKLLLGCKWLYSPGDPTPFSWRFASAWCGISERHAGEAIKELLRCRVIRVAGKDRVQGHDLTLFLPG